MAGSRRLSRLSASVLERAEQHLPDGNLVVAVSGGADSAVCAWAATRLRTDVRAVHVNHGWPASAGLEKAARTVAAELDLDCEVLAAEVTPGSSPEDRARAARYERLEGSLRAGEWLLTGHTADDQAETILGNLLRGAGAGGLTGIPRRRGRIVRPLLDVGRSETRELAGLLNLSWTDDPANLESRFRRTVLRREIIPYLQHRINPSFPAALLRMAAALAEDEAFLDALAAEIPIRVDGSGVRIPGPPLASAPPAVAVRVVRRALREAHGGYPGSAAEVAAVMKVAGGGPASELAGGARVERSGVWIVISGGPEKNAPGESTWVLPGTLTWGPWTLESWTEEVRPLAFSLSPFLETFDADLLPESLTVRPGRPADRIGMTTGSKSIADVLAEAGIPRDQRPGWPVVVAAGRVIWVPGVRRADAGWVGPSTRRYLWVRATVEGNS